MGIEDQEGGCIVTHLPKYTGVIVVMVPAPLSTT